MIMARTLPVFSIAAVLCLCCQFGPTLTGDAYEGNKIFMIHLTTKAQVKELSKLRITENLDILSRPGVGVPTSIRVTPGNRKSLESFIGKHDLKHSSSDLAIKASQGRSGKPKGEMSWDSYYDLEGITVWLENVAKKYPKLVKYEVIGKTHENREIRVVTIEHPKWNKKSATLLDCQIHAREWISSAQCTYIINELTTNSKKYEPLLRDVKFHIIPIVNPDGFAFSHTDSRYWRKNRRPHQDPACVGVDLNRNFPFHWNEVGGDSYACSEIYVGPSACSEPECQAVKKFMDKRMDEIDTYITMHSYGQVLLTPWSYNGKAPPDQNEIGPLTKAICKGLMSSGAYYRCGTSGDLFDALAGVSDDYAKSIGIKYTFTIELPPDSGGGLDGFNLPPHKILPKCQDTWKGVQIAASKKNLDGSRISDMGSGNSLQLAKTVLLLSVVSTVLFNG